MIIRIWVRFMKKGVSICFGGRWLGVFLARGAASACFSPCVA